MVGGEWGRLVVVLLCLGVANTQQWWGGRRLEVSHQQFSSFVPLQPQSYTAPRPVVIDVANNYKRNS